MPVANNQDYNQAVFNQGDTGPPQTSSCTTTLQQLSTKVYSRLDNNTLLYTQPEISSAINESLRVMNIITGYSQGTVEIESVANRMWYDFPGGVLFPLRIQFGEFFLRKVGLNRMGKRVPKWQADTTATTGKSVTSWIPYGLKRFAIHPADSAGWTTISIVAVMEIPLLVNLSDTVVTEPQFVDLIVDIAAHVAQVKEGGKILGDSMALYRRAVSRLKHMSIFQNTRMPFFAEEASHYGTR